MSEKLVIVGTNRGPELPKDTNSHHAKFVRNDGWIGMTLFNSPRHELKPLANSMNVPLVWTINEDPTEFDSGLVSIFNSTSTPKIILTGTSHELQLPIKGFEVVAREKTIEVFKILYPGYTMIVPED